MGCRNRFRLPLHDLQMHQDFARAPLGPGELVPFEIHKAHVLRFHETLAHQRRCAERDVFADPDREIPAVPIHILPLP